MDARETPSIAKEVDIIVKKNIINALFTFLSDFGTYLKSNSAFLYMNVFEVFEEVEDAEL